MGDLFNPHVNQGRAYIRYVCSELLKHPTIKSDLVLEMACFDYFVLFTQPRGQAMDCYARLFQSFCIRVWLGKKLKNVHMDDYLEFVVDLRFVYLDELHIGPKLRIWWRFCLQAQSCPNENIHRMFPNCVVCVWGT